ncbi:claudin-9-like [Petromyzon marinus]|uniref:claudin-9-like n=1 Tax=Petromyzon marinus TaxID=7757 RepID=UPI003F72D03F
MSSTGLEILGFSLGALGWLLGVVACALPTWRVTAFLGQTLIVAQSTWEGLWMNCVVQSTGQMQCKVHDSMLALNGELQAARAMTVLANLLALLAVGVAATGMRCTTCGDEDGSAKGRLTATGGVGFALCGLLMLAPVSWTAHNIVRDFYDVGVPVTLKRELGSALYVGWGAATLLFLGGGLLCCSWPRPEPGRPRPFYGLQPGGLAMHGTGPNAPGAPLPRMHSAAAAAAAAAAAYSAPPYEAAPAPCNGKQSYHVKEFV